MGLSDRMIPTSMTPNWKDIFIEKIVEINEPLVKLEQEERIFSQSFYYANNIEGALPDIWLRQGVVDRLKIAAQFLPESMGFLVLDGWRPYEVQKALRASIGREIYAKEPHLSQNEFEARLNEFVAEPRVSKDSPSPHLTGGSIDLTLCDLEGKPLDMGTEFDSPSTDSWTAAFEQDGKPIEIRERRRILFNAMINAGFTNLPTEWWHFDYGNQLWAHYHKQDAAMYTAANLYH